MDLNEPLFDKLPSLREKVSEADLARARAALRKIRMEKSASVTEDSDEKDGRPGSDPSDG